MSYFTGWHESFIIDKYINYLASMMQLREELDLFTLLKAEYLKVEKSIKSHESIYRKEALPILSFALNYPAKYLFVEDTLRMQKTLSPLISLMIAFIPPTSCKELLTLHASGRLTLGAVGNDSSEAMHDKGGISIIYRRWWESKVFPFKTFIDCVRQPQLNYDDFPFKNMLEDKTASPVIIKCKDNASGTTAFRDVYLK